MNELQAALLQTQGKLSDVINMLAAYKAAQAAQALVLQGKVSDLNSQLDALKGQLA